MKQNSPVILSIGVGAFNHEKFIHRAFESILSQQTSFSFEVIVFEYGSTDKTPSIVREYESKYPGIIRIISIPTHNLMEILECMYGYFSGKYFILIDGDDYWTDGNKLQKQISFLEDHPDFNGCFHDAEIIRDTGSAEINDPVKRKQSLNDFRFYSQFNSYKTDFYPWDLLQRNILPTASFMSYTSFLRPFIDRYRNAKLLSVDWALQLFCIKSGKFRYFNSAWSVYNDHSGGISKTIPLAGWKRSNIEFLKSLVRDEYFRNIRKDVLVSIKREYLELLHVLMNTSGRNQEWRKAKRDYARYSRLSVRAELEYFSVERRKTKQILKQNS